MKGNNPRFFYKAFNNNNKFNFMFPLRNPMKLYTQQKTKQKNFPSSIKCNFIILNKKLIAHNTQKQYTNIQNKTTERIH